MAMEGSPAPKCQTLERQLIGELARFIGLVPLAFASFRSPFDPLVTASDASTTGGGVCVSRGLTPYGASAALCHVRGDIPEEHDFCQVLCVGLFDGISGIRVSLDALGAPVAGHISVEKLASARRVVESFFPDTIFVEDVNDVTEELVIEWSLRFSSVGLIVLGSGPPCQGVSGLNADRRGALKDHRSCLFSQVPRIKHLFIKHFPWAQVRSLVENVASMDSQDCKVMNEAFENKPWVINASGVSLANRPRVYWVDWELQGETGVTFEIEGSHALPAHGEVRLLAQVDAKKFLKPGWAPPEGHPLPTFTTSRPSSTPHRRPAGLKACRVHEIQRWHDDKHRYPPYQYRDENILWNTKGEGRLPDIQEREAILGFPWNYTKQCWPKSQHGSEAHDDERLTLLGNSWSIPVVTWLLGQLLQPLGLIEPVTLQEIVNRLTPGQGQHLQGILQRAPLEASTKTVDASDKLVQKICSLTSLKGEDILLQGQTDIPVKFHRLRASLPAKLWRWRTVSGWTWKSNDEHINVLELRAVLTSVKWRVEHLEQRNLRCIHLVDSLVVLHGLTRGRSSSRKLQRTPMRISSYLLVSGLQPLWGYVDTSQNPADRPSRRGVKRSWLKKPNKR